jgi:mannose-1-phosphate guanylyltransferase
MFQSKISSSLDIPTLVVILSGGAGTRLWPLSREHWPKPFLKINGGYSLLQRTCLRARALPMVREMLTVTSHSLYHQSLEQYRALDLPAAKTAFILEPLSKNSMASVCLAALYAEKYYPQGCRLLVLPADHLIHDEAAFIAAYRQACDLADQMKIVTFGIQPDSPKTAYGYIQHEGVELKKFVEKPDQITADGFINSGGYLWNSGMFCLRSELALSEIQTHASTIMSACRASFIAASQQFDESVLKITLNSEQFAAVDNISIDYALMEKTENAAVVPCDIGWTDVGSWLEFGANLDADEHQNRLAGQVVLDDVNDCIIHGHDRLVAAIGLRDLLIVDTQDAVLVAHKSKSQAVKNMVAHLKRHDHPTHREFPTVRRPWGSYTILDEQSGFKVKRIEVLPGASLSLQSHQHRHEHWVVVDGIAQVTLDEKIVELKTNQSIYIQAGAKHRLANKTDQLVVLIETQSGPYLGEDDIVRYEDVYGRVKDKALCS